MDILNSFDPCEFAEPLDKGQERESKRFTPEYGVFVDGILVTSAKDHPAAIDYIFNSLDKALFSRILIRKVG